MSGASVLIDKIVIAAKRRPVLKPVAFCVFVIAYLFYLIRDFILLLLRFAGRLMRRIVPLLSFRRVIVVACAVCLLINAGVLGWARLQAERGTDTAPVNGVIVDPAVPLGSGEDAGGSLPEAADGPLQNGVEDELVLGREDLLPVWGLQDFQAGDVEARRIIVDDGGKRRVIVDFSKTITGDEQSTAAGLDVLPDGAQVVDADAVHVLKSGDSGQLQVVIADEADELVVVFSLAQLLSLPRDTELCVLAQVAEYALPLRNLDFTRVGAAFAAALPEEILIELSIAAYGNLTEAGCEASLGAGVEPLPVVLDFEVQARYQGRVMVLSDYSGYVRHTFRLPASLSMTDFTAALQFEPDGSMRSVPYTARVLDDVVYVDVYSFSNSLYSLVYAPRNYADLSGHWAEAVILELAGRLVTGAAAGDYQPEAAMSGLDFLAELFRGLGIAESSWPQQMTDELTQQNPLIRQQAILSVLELMRYYQLDAYMAADSTRLLSRFGDYQQVPEALRADLEGALQYGIFNGTTDERILPLKDLTRAEAMTLIHNLLGRLGLL